MFFPSTPNPAPPTQSMPDLHSQNTDTERIETLLHQLRNPLTAIATFAKLLDKRRQPDDPDGWIVERIEQECQHMRSLLERFEDGDVSQGVETESESNHPSSHVSLKSFVKELWPTYAALAAERRIEALLEDSLGSATAVTSNPLGLREAIDNLMDNALKYTPAGGTVVLAVAEGGDTITVQVKDTGPGIAQPDLAQIFQRHFRVEGERPGHGLGLAIARDVVTGMGGTLTVESAVGQGTEFTIQLPISRVADCSGVERSG
ncbi:MAG: HAMP domain-containing sensor histidine kinase [Cyanobacteria bacterium P01_A01_bin.3]